MARGTNLPNHIAIGWFDLDDFRSHVAEHLCAIRPHQDGGQIDNLQALEWSCRLSAC